MATGMKSQKNGTKKKGAVVAVLCVVILALLAAAFYFFYWKDRNDTQKPAASEGSVSKTGTTELAYTDLLAEQTKIDSELKEELKKGYTLEEPKVVVNPYGNAPLTAMVLFSTTEETTVKAVIHGKDGQNDITVTFPSEKDHALPIYGLYNNAATVVDFTLEDGTTKSIEIQTEQAEIDWTAEDKAAPAADRVAFAAIHAAGGQYTGAAYDSAKDIRWLLSGISDLKVIRSKGNGRLQAAVEVEINGAKTSAVIYEMDLCGKIYEISCIDTKEAAAWVHEEAADAVTAMYPDGYSFKLGTKGEYSGSLGRTEAAEAPAYDTEKAKDIDFTLSALTHSYDRIAAAGSWKETSADAALVFVSQTGNKVYSFQIPQTGSDFSVWVTPESLEGGYSYDIFLYNQGVTYATGKYVTLLIDTRTAEENEGAQLAVYDLKERTYGLTALNPDKTIQSETITTEKSKVTETAEIQAQLTAELTSGSYTLEAPMTILNPFQNTPLSAVILFQTEDEVQVKVTVKGKTEEASIVSVLDAGKDHQVPVVGLYPDYENEVVLELLDKNGNTTEKKSVKIQTEALPDTLKDIVHADYVDDNTQMGLMLISGLKTPYLYAFDRAGEIRWYCTDNTVYYGAFPLANGNFLMEADNVLMPNASMPNSPEFYEMDFLGRAHRVYYFPEGVHHEIKEKEPDGNFMIATNSQNGYEQDMIQEIDRKTGAVVKSLDITKLFEGCEYIDRNDWTHINTVSYDADTDTILISMRNVSAGVRINWSTDEIEWILGDPDMWKGTKWEDKVLTPVGDITWHYEQHTVYEIKEDVDNNPDTIHVMLFDNHNPAHRDVPNFDGIRKSYVALYSINTKDWTVTQDHRYELELSKITSDFQWDAETQRVFAVGAYLAKTLEHDAVGIVYEYDFDSEEKLSRFLIGHRFYRGYNLHLDLNDYAAPLEVEENYHLGELHAPVEVEARNLATKRNFTTSKVTFHLVDQMLYIYAPDHSYTQVIFNGTEHTYVYSIADIKQMQRNGSAYDYRLPIPLNGLAADTYSMQIVYNDKLYNISHQITVTE